MAQKSSSYEVWGLEVSMKLKQARKAIAAAALPVISALVMWASTGALDTTELSVGISGLLAALVVYYVPNANERG